MTGRRCLGCDSVITPSPRERNPKLWCSQACRARRLRATGRLRTPTYYPRCHIWSHRCVVCSELYTGRSQVRSTCPSRSCKRAANAARAKAYMRSRGGNTIRQDQVREPCTKCGETIAHAPHTDPIHRRCRPGAADHVDVWQEGPCAWCGQRFVGKAGHRVYCSFRCAHAAGDSRRRARRVGATGEFTWAEITRLWLTFGKACAYCRQPTTDYQPDHVVPLSKGGSNALPNLLPCCPACNRQKHALLLHEWMQWRTGRGLHPYTPWITEPHLYVHLTAALPVAA